MVSDKSKTEEKPSKWPRLAAFVGGIAVVAGVVENLDKIGKFARDWLLQSEEKPNPTIVINITKETLLQAASIAASAAARTSGPEQEEALHSEIELTKAASRPNSPAVLGPPPKWLAIALAELGQAEVAGEEDNPRIVEYLKATSLPEMARHDATPWASAFVNWAFAQANVKGSGTANPEAWLKWGKQISEPRTGALVLAKRSGPLKVGAACFFVTETEDSVLCLGGNFHDSVAMTAINKATIIGYRWPLEQ